jgi:hypothetical protein
LLQIIKLPVMQGLDVTYGSYALSVGSFAVTPSPGVCGVIEDGKIR